MGDAEEVTVTADDNLQTLIRTTVENGWLVIDTPDNQNYKPSRPVVVRVNGQVAFDGVITESVQSLLEWHAEDDDRTMLYTAALPVRVP